MSAAFVTFTVFDPTTGRVEYTGQCAASDLQYQCPESHLELVEGHYPDDKFYWNGQQMAAFPLRPSALHIWDYIERAWVFDVDRAWSIARQKRDRLLTESDWTQLSDAPLTPEQKSSWTTYRQALRDVTNQPDPSNIVWPTPPS